MPPVTITSEERHCLQNFLEDGKKYGLRFENGKLSFNVGTGVVLFETYGALLNLEPQSDESPNEIWNNLSPRLQVTQLNRWPL
jgi:hypothetical protein